MIFLVGFASPNRIHPCLALRSSFHMPSGLRLCPYTATGLPGEAVVKAGASKTGFGSSKLDDFLLKTWRRWTFRPLFHARWTST